MKFLNVLKKWWKKYNAFMSTPAGETPIVVDDAEWKQSEINDINNRMLCYLNRRASGEVKDMSKDEALYKAVTLLRYAETHPLFNQFIQTYADTQYVPQERYNFDIPDNLYAIKALTARAAVLMEYALIEKDCYQLDVGMAAKARTKGFNVGTLTKDFYGSTSFFTQFGNKVEDNYVMEFGRV